MKQQMSFMVAKLGINDPDRLIKEDVDIAQVSELSLDGVIGRVYLKKSKPRTPVWFDMVNSYAKDELEEQSGSANSAVIIFESVTSDGNYKHLVIVSFGRGYHMIESSMLLSDFGYIVAGKQLSTENLSGVDSINFVGDLIKLSRELMVPGEGPVEQLIGGSTEAPRRFQGYTTLSDDAEEDANDLAKLIGANVKLGVHKTWKDDELYTAAQSYLDIYYDDTLAMNHIFDNVMPISSGEDLSKLDDLLRQAIASENSRNSISILQDTVGISAVEYQGKKYSPETIRGVLNDFAKKISTQEGAVGWQHETFFVNDENGEQHTQSIYRTLVAELPVLFKGRRAVFVEGKWWLFSEEFSKQLENDLILHVKNHEVMLPGWDTSQYGDETAYNRALNESLNGLELHKDNYRFEKNSPIEIADVVAEDLSFYYVKHWTGAGTFSHLLNQVLVTGQFIADRTGNDFNTRLIERLNDEWHKELHAKDLADDATFVLVIAGKSEVQELSYFAKISLRQFLAQMRQLNLKVELSFIDYANFNEKIA